MSFTERQLEIARLKREGLANKEIARRLGKSESYVSQALKTIIGKIKTVQDSTNLLIQMGIISKPTYKLSAHGYDDILLSTGDLRHFASAATKVSVLGPEDTNTAVAAKKHWGKNVKLLPEFSFLSVFDDVEKEEADYGLIPIYETAKGYIDEYVDLLGEYDVHIVGKTRMKVHHCLLAKQSKENLQVIGSHRRVLSICREYLSENFPNARLKEESSTAEAAIVASKNPTYGAIGSKWLAEDYGIKILDHNIASNTTTFVIISSEALGNQEPLKSHRKVETMIVIDAKKDQIGLLQLILKSFTENKINLSMAKASTCRKTGKPRFFISFRESLFNQSWEKVSNEIKSSGLVESIRVLGSYPQVS